MNTCVLCGSKETFQHPDFEFFIICSHCKCVFRAPKFYVTSEEEKQRYLVHDNNVENQGYQQSVRPLVDAIIQQYTKKHIGLDFGAGTGPVISKLLNDQGFEMKLWDPFFHTNSDVLKKKYSFIVCSEVMEHFHSPLKEFKLMYQLLKSDGILFCKTELLPKPEEFKDWYYKNDKTHVIFYHKETLSWIKNTVGFNGLQIAGNLICFTK